MLHSISDDSNTVSLDREQHLSWATIGFIRSLATNHNICRALSTDKWIELLVDIVSNKHDIHIPKALPKQVSMDIITLFMIRFDGLFTFRRSESHCLQCNLNLNQNKWYFPTRDKKEFSSDLEFLAIKIKNNVIINIITLFIMWLDNESLIKTRERAQRGFDSWFKVQTHYKQCNDIITFYQKWVPKILAINCLMYHAKNYSFFSLMTRIVDKYNLFHEYWFLNHVSTTSRSCLLYTSPSPRD